MPLKAIPAIVGILIAISLCSCNKSQPAPVAQPQQMEPSGPMPLYKAGTVAEFASYEGSMRVQVSGYGIVVGLANNGSTSAGVPPQVEVYLKEYLLKKGLGSFRQGTEKVTPEVVLRDLDTAVVLVGGNVPVFAPVGTRYDLTVTALPQTQTISLQNGYLMPVDLYLAVGGTAAPGGGTKPLAEAKGHLFLNPYLDPGNHKDIPKLREARILNGGVVTQSAPVRIVLRQADHQLCSLIARRINERFPDAKKVANAINTQVIELNIPKEHRRDYVHFLDLILHLPLRAGSGVYEAKAKEIAAAIEAPNANADELALVWEAMGRQILPMIKGVCGSRNSASAFYAARTCVRLGDQTAMEVLVCHARSASSAFRLPAIYEIGRHSSVNWGHQDLLDLLDDPDDNIRIAAYEALLMRGETQRISRVTTGNFHIDQVQSKRPMIYATQIGQAKVVIFGDKLSLQKEIFLSTHDDEITISSNADRTGLIVVRKVLRNGRLSEPFNCDYHVASLLGVLGLPPERDSDGKVRGLGVSYSQVLGILHQMCKRQDIPAKFVLQQPPGVQRIYDSAPAGGRPDLPAK